MSDTPNNSFSNSLSVGNYLLPNGWMYSKLKYVCKMNNGNSIPDEEKELYSDPENSIPYISSKDIDASTNEIDYNNGMYIKKTDSSFKVAKKGTFLICIEGGSAGKKVGMLNQDCCFVNKLCNFEATNIDSRYLYWYVQSYLFKKQFYYDMSGLIGGVSIKKMQLFRIPVPPKDVQKKIVDYLDKTIGLLDKQINLHKRIIQNFNDLKKSMKNEAVFSGIFDEESKDTGVEWIGKTPKSWKQYRLGNLYEESSEPGEEGLPFLTVSINSGISDKELGEDEQDRIFVRSEDKTKNKRVRPNDLAFNMMRAWQGAFGTAKVNGMISPSYIVARPKVELSSIFIEWLLRSPNGMEEVRRRSHGIADFRLRLYWSEFKNIVVSIPDYETQLKIVTETDKKLNAIDTMLSKEYEIINLYIEYKESLISEVMEGQWSY